MKLSLGLTLFVLFHVLILTAFFPLWVTGLALSFVVLKLINLKFKRKIPYEYELNNVIAVISCALVIIEFHSLIGIEPAGSFLIILAALKLNNLEKESDYKFVLFIVLGLLSLIILGQQSLATTILMVFDIFVIFAFFAKIQEHSVSLGWSSFKSVGKAFLQTLPIWAIVFVLFPRTGVPWGTGLKPKQGYTGISDSLAPGSIESLVGNKDPVFRAKSDFELSPDLLYWRGLVLDQSNGLRWNTASQARGTSSADIATPISPESSKGAMIYDQEILMEATDQKWVYGMDTPFEMEPLQALVVNNLKMKVDGTWELTRAPSSGFYYHVRSLGEISQLPLSEVQVNHYLQLPERLSPKVSELTGKIVSQVTSDEDAVRAFLKYFSSTGFRYTWKDVGLEGDELESFLLNTKKGFCSHYAASLGTMLRIAGIPSRLVVGFQGGVKNPVNGVTLVKKSDAHVWVEYWNREKNRWKRVDPTTVVAPLRLELGSDFYDLSEEEIQGVQSQKSRIQKSFFVSLVNSLRFVWDSVSLAWQKFLISYDFESQKRLRDYILFKISEHQREMLFGSMLMIAIFGFFLTKWWRLRKLTPLQKLENDVIFHFEKLGIKAQTWEGEESFFKRVSKTFPHFEALITEYASELIYIKYSRGGESKQSLKSLKITTRALLKTRLNRRNIVINKRAA